MSDHHVSLYVKHPDSRVHNLISNLFALMSRSYSDKAWETVKLKYGQIASLLNNKKGKLNAQAMFVNVDRTALCSENMSLKSGYIVAKYIHGKDADDNIYHLIDFVMSLIQGIDIRAYIIEEGELWELFVRYENGEVKNKPYYPFANQRADSLALNSGVYHWWHKGLPDDIKIGMLQGHYFEPDFDAVDIQEPTKANDDESSKEKKPASDKTVKIYNAYQLKEKHKDSK